MNNKPRKKRVKKLPPPAIGELHGIPILAATATPCRNGCYTVVVICPICGKKNGHGIPSESSVGGSHHRAADCPCYPQGGYFFQVVSIVEPKVRR